MNGFRGRILLGFCGLAAVAVMGMPSGASSAPAVKLKLIAPKTAEAGKSVQIKVKVLKGKRTLKSYRGKVKFAISVAGSSSKLPKAYRFKKKDRGVHTFKGVVLTRAGPQSLSVTDTKRKSIKGRAPVSVSHSALDSLSASTQPDALAGQEFTVQISGADRYANGIPTEELVSTATATISPQGTCAGLTCSSTKSGSHSITVSVGDKSADADIEVVAGPLDSMDIQASDAWIAGEDNEVSLTGADQYGNEIAPSDIAAWATVSVALGNCDGLTCFHAVAGVHTITATTGPVIATRNVTVFPGPLDQLEIDPQGTFVAPTPRNDVHADYTPLTANPTSREYTLTGLDAYSNPIGDLTSSATFSIDDVECDANECSSSTPGTAVIKGTVDGKSDTTSLTVSPFEGNYSMTCRGVSYDVNGAMSDGCEESAADDPATTRATSRFIGNASDCDGLAQLRTSALYSDNRTHTNPTVSEFDTNKGNAPRWYKLHVADDSFCQADGDIRLSVSGSNFSTCHQLTVIVDYDNGTAEISSTAHTTPSSLMMDIDYDLPGISVDSSANWYFKIERFCNGPDNRDAPTFTLSAEF